jgi:hypothetical protein
MVDVKWEMLPPQFNQPNHFLLHYNNLFIFEPLKLNSHIVKLKQKAMFCPKCGASLKEGAKFCHACGATIGDAPVNPQPQPPPPQPQQQFQNPYQNMSPTEANAAASNLFTRAINIMFSPAKEWKVVENETANTSNILLMYVLPLALIPAIFSVIGYGLVGYHVGWGPWSMTIKSWPMGISTGLTSLISSLVAVFLTAFIVDALAPSFKTQKNFGKALQLVAYSMTPMWVAGVFNFYPPIAFISFLAGIYGLVLLYWGFAYTMKPSKESTVGYYLATLGILIAIYIVLALIIGLIFTAIFVSSYSPGVNWNMH